MNCGRCGTFWDPYGHLSRLVRQDREDPYYAVYCAACVAALDPPPYRVRIRVYAANLTDQQKQTARWQYGGYWLRIDGVIYKRIAEAERLALEASMKRWGVKHEGID